ncbi:putative hydro-lyase [Thalassotalea mangrovi]|uniref:Putative hydro-lyase E8M12_12810 n=1 Tax=Thalassotalea mangrovi TaxID=2572245 RepID=A0A4U1B3I4_9GAMM|nr:putative hydro-lyase [Thalassotalea mangrovi]TKB44086.1 putative hydro-lyase [Thalassotalea mangrovi]
MSEPKTANTLNALSSPRDVRQAIRNDLFRSHTSGLAKGYVQCNLVILEQELAADFLLFCQKNPKPCPLVAMSDAPGNPRISGAGKDVDIRSDVPQYKVFEHGKLTAQVNDVQDIWQDNFVSFLLGCSFSFEEALIDDGIEIRNIAEGVNVPMYNTTIACKPAGAFSANMVVSMRPMKASDAIRAIQICSRFPNVHGAPVHFGDPELIGIYDIDNPDYGDRVTIKPGEVPVFWACGVTPQVAISNAKPAISITHSPGCMLITDIRNSQLSVL